MRRRPGFQAISRDDFDNMARQFPLYDALYAFCRTQAEAPAPAAGAVRVSPRGRQERHRRRRTSGGSRPPGASPIDAVAAGTEPDAELAPGAVKGLAGDGLRAGAEPSAARHAPRPGQRRPASSASAATSRRRRASGSTSGRCPPSATATRPRATASWRTSSAWSRSSQWDADVPLQHRGFIELPAHAKSGGFDHAAVHEPTGRIYVAHTANDAVDVIETAPWGTGSRLGQRWRVAEGVGRFVLQAVAILMRASQCLLEPR